MHQIHDVLSYRWGLQGWIFRAIQCWIGSVIVLVQFPFLKDFISLLQWKSNQRHSTHKKTQLRARIYEVPVLSKAAVSWERQLTESKSEQSTVEHGTSAVTLLVRRYQQLRMKSSRRPDTDVKDH